MAEIAMAAILSVTFSVHFVDVHVAYIGTSSLPFINAQQILISETYGAWFPHLFAH